MRLLLASLVASAVPLGGCSLVETCEVDMPSPFSDVTVEAVGVTAADTLTVLYVSGAIGDEAEEADLTPTPSADGTLRLTVEGGTYEADVPPRFETAVRGDTVFVRVARDLFREACTPSEAPYTLVTAAEAPAGVRVVRFRTVWHTDVPFPSSALPASRAPLFFTV